jgi:hypothetical protein
MAAVTLKPFLRIARPALYRCPLCGFKTNRKNGGLEGMCPNFCHWIIPNVLGIDNSRQRTFYRVKRRVALAILQNPWVLCPHSKLQAFCYSNGFRL